MMKIFCFSLTENCLLKFHFLENLWHFPICFNFRCKGIHQCLSVNDDNITMLLVKKRKEKKAALLLLVDNADQVIRDLLIVIII